MAGIRRYEPWGVLGQLQNEIDRLFDNRMEPAARTELASSDWVPAVDIKEEQDKYMLHVDVPGVNPKDIHVQMEGGVLTISGERKHERREAENGYKRVERVSGSFFRRFSLPDSVDSDGVSAKCNQGVLEVIIPKTQKSRSRKIAVEG
ncbi:MAG: Hsp20/alpha crystallin family protein [Gammaproteobacteria bacterium]|nr:Hsp20/alpha crystallin family protein [Gammaproteobacteria bacterium]